MKVLLTGASGQVGRALQSSAPASTEIRAVTRAELDISDGAAVRRAVADFAPAVVINAAAYTAVDKAESEPLLAETVNATGPRHLAEAVKDIAGARLIQISTDYVFNGLGTEPHRPDDPTHPVSAYGRTKLAGERAVLEVLADRSVVLRTAWIYAAEGKNFLLTMLRLMRERGAVRCGWSPINAARRRLPHRSRARCGASWSCRALMACCIGPTRARPAGANSPALLPKRLSRPACWSGRRR